VKTAVSEAVTNCIVHAYPGAVGPVLLRCRIVGENEAEITVKDKGVGIADVARAMEPLYTSGDPAERAGMGFSIMESFMDSVHILSRPGKGTLVRMRKKLSGRAEK
jgi:stage II sporulation protein AB (anti-sigma F factor)